VSNQPPVPVTVIIMDKEYRVACPPDERDALLASASLLNERMREIRDSGKVIGAERIGVMAALNIAHELVLQRHTPTADDHPARSRIRALQHKIESALNEGKQLEL